MQKAKRLINRTFAVLLISLLTLILKKRSFCEEDLFVVNIFYLANVFVLNFLPTPRINQFGVEIYRDLLNSAKMPCFTMDTDRLFRFLFLLALCELERQCFSFACGKLNVVYLLARKQNICVQGSLCIYGHFHLLLRVPRDINFALGKDHSADVAGW